MPIKFGKDSKKFPTRGSSKYIMEYDYMKCRSKKDLIEAFNKENTKPKLRAKIRNELVRRGGIVFMDKSDEEIANG
tara:strand:+ start:391 stop:618 length:228 start_codon:yes stop_codon:yes gene_type:complete